MSSEADTRSRNDSSKKRARFLLTAFSGDQAFPLDLPEEGSIVFGRAEGCDLRVDHPSVSRRHARFHVGRPVTIEDLESRNGTIVRGTAIGVRQRVGVKPGDVIECGDVVLLVCELRTEPTSDDPAMTESVVDPFAGSPAGLVVGAAGNWFQPVGGMRINLGRRGPLRRVLFSLARQRLSRPGTALKVHALIHEGWPGERILPDAALSRIYTTVQRLRSLGLQQILLTNDEGYLLDPAMSVRIEEV